MPDYIQFQTADGGIVLVEVEPQQMPPRGGVTKASGLRDWVKKNIGIAEAKLDDALHSAVRQNVRPFVKIAQDLAKDSEVNEMQVTFGLTVTGEVGNVAVGKAGAQSNYTVTLKWTQAGEGEFGGSARSDG